MIFCYSRVICHVWFNTGENRETNHAIFKSRRKLTKLFIILTITFLFTWTPTFGRPIVTRYGNGENATKYQLFSMLLALLGSAANPVIYSFRCPRFRLEVIKLLTCCSCKRKRQVNRNRIFAAGSFSLKETKKDKSYCWTYLNLIPRCLTTNSTRSCTEIILRKAPYFCGLKQAT